MAKFMETQDSISMLHACRDIGYITNRHLQLITRHVKHGKRKPLTKSEKQRLDSLKQTCQAMRKAKGQLKG